MTDKPHDVMVFDLLVRRNSPLRIRLVAQILSVAKLPVTEDAIADRIAGKGKWCQALRPMNDTFIAPGRARRVKSEVLSVG